MNRSILLVVLFLVMLISACGRSPIYEDLPEYYDLQIERSPLRVEASNEMAYVLNHALMRRVGINQTQNDHMADLMDGRTAFNGNHILRRQRFYPSTAFLLIEDAINDIIWLFDELRYFYGAYIFMGGDNAFNRVRDDLIETMRHWGNPFIYTHELLYEIGFYLYPVLNDRHAYMIYNDHFYWFGHYYGFLFYHGQFYNNPSGFNRGVGMPYVTRLSFPFHFGFNNLCIESSFRLSLCNVSGEFVYTIVIPFYDSWYYHRRLPNFITIHYHDDSIETVPIQIMHQYYPTMDAMQMARRTAPSLVDINGIPVVTIPAMWDGFYHASEARRFRQQLNDIASSLYNEPIVIIDIRNNQGGLLDIPVNFFYNLMRINVPPNFSFVSVGDYHHVTNQLEVVIFGDLKNHMFGALPMTPSQFGYNQTLLQFVDDGIVYNDTLIILLTNHLTESAGEFMTDILFNIENTLVIGTNTGGTFVSTYGRASVLPRSRIRFYFNCTYLIHPPNHFSEGLGIAPDIWVRGDALEAALRMLDRHITQTTHP